MQLQAQLQSVPESGSVPSGSSPVLPATLRARRPGLHTGYELLIWVRSDSPLCLSQGFRAQMRLVVSAGEKRVIAVLQVLQQGQAAANWLALDEIGVSESVWSALQLVEGQALALRHPTPGHAFAHVRAKTFGAQLKAAEMQSIIDEIVDGQFSEVEIACFVAACSGRRLQQDEVVALTRAMVAAGRRMQWPQKIVLDKHCVGGLPGNRTTPIVVSILAALGLTIPKTSSRAITSPAGTADTMETLAPVDLDGAQMRAVVEQEGGCIIWGGAINLSPADDILIRVERKLGMDSDGQMVASMLSKKIAAGSTHVLIDIPVGPSAKVRTVEAARYLSNLLEYVGTALGIVVRCVQSDGSGPVGVGIGPALEAFDVLAVLQNAADAPQDLRRRALFLAGQLLEMGGKAEPGQGLALAASCLDSGAAWRKMQAICAAQGGMRTPPKAEFTRPLLTSRGGRVKIVDNLALAQIAKLAGAPQAAAAGLQFLATPGKVLQAGEPWLIVHAESAGQLDYACQFAASRPDLLIWENT